MFLSLFPFPEVASIIAICLAWIYIAFGIMGNSQQAGEDIAAQNLNPVQEQIYQAPEVKILNDRTCFWHYVSDLQAEISEDPPLLFFVEKTRKFLIRQDHFIEKSLAYNLPNRAPPVI